MISFWKDMLNANRTVSDAAVKGIEATGTFS